MHLKLHIFTNYQRCLHATIIILSFTFFHFVTTFLLYFIYEQASGRPHRVISIPSCVPFFLLYSPKLFRFLSVLRLSFFSSSLITKVSLILSGSLYFIQSNTSFYILLMLAHSCYCLSIFLLPPPLYYSLKDTV